MTSLRIRCSACNAKLSAPLNKLERPCTCPKCNQTITPSLCPSRDIQFNCPKCRQTLLVDKKFAARKSFHCPNCSHKLRIQLDESAPTLTAAQLTEDEIQFLTQS